MRGLQMQPEGQYDGKMPAIAAPYLDDGMCPGADCEAPIRANMEVARERIRSRHARQSECLMPNLAGVNLDPLDAQCLLRK